MLNPSGFCCLLLAGCERAEVGGPALFIGALRVWGSADVLYFAPACPADLILCIEILLDSNAYGLMLLGHILVQAFRGFAGTSVLILVGVATDTARKVRAEQAMAKYKDIDRIYDDIKM